MCEFSIYFQSDCEKILYKCFNLVFILDHLCKVMTDFKKEGVIYEMWTSASLTELEFWLIIAFVDKLKSALF